MSDIPNEQPPTGEVSALQTAYADVLPVACPPPNATDASGTYYAAHSANPPGPMDFRTAAVSGAFPGKDECQRRSNSIMGNVQDARHLVKLAPGRFKFVSQGVLMPSHGKLKHTPSGKHPSHYSLWRYAGVTMHSLFTTVV